MSRRPGRALLLAACLSFAAIPSTTAQGAIDVPTAVEATMETGSMGVDFVFALSGQTPDGIQTLSMGGTGALELGSTPRMWLTLDMSEYGLGTLEIKLDDRALYVRGDEWAEELGDLTWIGADLDSLDPAVDEWRSYVSGQNDAALALYWLLGATGKPAAIKRERVGDVPTERLVMHLDLDLALDRVPPAIRPVLQRTIDEARARAIEPLFEADVWVGDDGLVHRVKYAFEDLPQGVTDMTVTYDFRDFGEPVDLQLPDPADVLVVGADGTQ